HRYHYNDLETSDEYFRKILAAPNHENSSEEHCLAWEAIAKGNLGGNLHKQGKYDEAIPLLEFARKTMAGINDFAYASGMVALLADVYLEKKNLTQCKYYIDMGVDYIQRSYPSQRWERLYPVMAKYYTIMGNTILAAAYQDSALIYQKKAYEEYDALKLVYAEQQASRLEQQAKEEELQVERVQTAYYKHVAFYVGIILLIITGLLLYAINLYRRKRAVYRALVKKSQEWAADRKESVKPEETTVVTGKPNEVELALMERIRKLMDEERMYINVHFTLNSMVEQLGVNRTYISATLNKCAGKTFTQYINEYRIREAIDIMSAKENQYLTIDNIAYNSGFSDRRTFHRIFKKVTGLTPSEFRTNLPGTSARDF
ncbi:AraC family transcriptional regulator, partial [Bacteroides sp. 51]|uniref:helix-turn-helix domain-containing protein n=1 Tax=Bacteroides sp. 51 TaxID=2302938 RepID=UPI0013D08D34